MNKYNVYHMVRRNGESGLFHAQMSQAIAENIGEALENHRLDCQEVGFEVQGGVVTHRFTNGTPILINKGEKL